MNAALTICRLLTLMRMVILESEESPGVLTNLWFLMGTSCGTDLISRTFHQNYHKYTKPAYIYQKNHFLFNLFPLTAGLATKIAAKSPPTVQINCFLLNVSLNKSNVPEGDVRVKNMSNPDAKTRDVDSRSDGAVVMRWVFAISYS
jgi:hypothetical protein